MKESLETYLVWESEEVSSDMAASARDNQRCEKG
jgi:hypothetical protein